MDRRKYLKSMTIGALGAGAIINQSCETKPVEEVAPQLTSNFDRQPVEKALEEKLKSETFFDPHEMATIAVLADIIIPKDETSGSATDAKVPDFIEFIVKDIPSHQLPMRGGLKWLDLQCMKRHNDAFINLSSAQQIELIDEIAYPEKAKPEMQQGVSFFNKMRDLTATGFFTSEIGIKDLGYMGNKPNQWNGVPQDVLDKHNVSYTERELNESVKFD